MATDWLLVAFICSFAVAIVFTILGYESDFPQSVIYTFFGMLGAFMTAFLFWGSGSVWVPFGWIFEFIAWVNFIVVITDSLKALNVYRRNKRALQ